MQNRRLGISLSYLYTALNMICGLFLSSFLLRMLGDTDYGVYQTASSFAMYLVLFEFGTGTVITRNIAACKARNASKEEIDHQTSTIWTITVGLAFLILVVSVAFYCLFGAIYANSLSEEQIVYGKRIFIFITIYLIVSFFSQTLNGMLIANEKYSVQPIVSIIRVIVRTATLFGLIFFIRQAILIAIVDMVISIGIGLFNFIYCRIKFDMCVDFRKFDKGILKASLPLCFAIFLQTIVNQANSNVGKFIIGVKLTPESVTMFSVGLYIYGIFSSLTTIPISMYGPQIVRDVSRGISGKELTEKLIQPSRFIVLIGGCVLFGFIAVGREFIEIVYGAEYMQAWWIALIIMIPMLINMSNGILVNVLDATDKRLFRSWVLFATTLLNIILTIFLIDIWGIIGAAISTALCTFLGQVFIMDIYYSKALNIRVFYMYFKTFHGILLFQILATAISMVVIHFISNVYLSFFVGGILFVVLFALGYLLLGTNKAEKRIILKVKNKIFGRKNDKTD